MKFPIKMQKKIVPGEILLILFCFIVNSQISTAQSLSSEKSQYLFIENKGQVADADGNKRPDVLFTAENSGAIILLRSTGLSYVTSKTEGVFENEETLEDIAVANEAHLIGQRVDVDFINTNADMQVIKENASPFHYNYYYDHCPDGVTMVKAFNKVTYRDIYNGVDGIFYSRENGFKYDLVVRPGADPSEIRLAYTGSDKITQENGKIIISTCTGIISEWMPKIYQVINGEVKSVDASYVLNENNVLSFSIGEYNKNVALVIDPWVTFLGGSGSEHGLGIDADTNGDVVITGYTTSPSLPTNAGVFQLAYGGLCDAYIAKFNTNGGLVFCTYYGRNTAERGTGVVFDAVGDIYFCGATRSTLMSTVGVFQPALGGASDVLIAKFNGSGVRVWASYCGGSGMDEATGLELDGSGNLFVTGFTSGGFPTTAGAFQTAFRGIQDAFIVKINIATPNPTRVWSTYIGGSLEERAADIDIDVFGNVLVVGRTLSNNFPVTAGAAQTSIASVSTDAFVAKFTNAGAIIWSTYYGGTSGEEGMGISSDAIGNIIFGGQTTSSNFPVSVGAFSTTKALSPYAGTITKFNSSGTMLWSTYFGNAGTGGCEVYGVTIDRARDLVYISGGVYLNGLPLWNCAHQPASGGGGIGGEDLFIAKINTIDGYPLCNTYLGGAGHDDGTITSPVVYGNPVGFVGGNIAFNNYDVYITGYGISTYPTTAGAYQQSFGGGIDDAVVAKICGFSCGDNDMSMAFSASKTNICKGEAINFSDLSTLCDVTNAQWQWTFFGANTTSSTLQNPAGISYNNTGSYNVKLVITTPCGKDSLLLPGYINVGGPTAVVSSVNNITCFGLANGSATVGSISGAAPFTYNWNNAATGNSISNLSAGVVYSVTITDTYGCTSATSVSVTQPSLLIALAITSSTVLCTGGNNGSINSVVAGGTVPYTYSWNNTNTNSAISSLGQGTYYLTVTDNYGCTTISNNISMVDPTPISINLSATDALCNLGATGTATVSASGGAGGYNYLWSNSVAGNNVNSLQAGNYTVTVTDANGCIGTNTIMVNEPTAISLSMSTTDAHCNQSDGSATVVATGGVVGYGYLWNNSIATANNSGIPAGVYSVTVTDGNQCVATSSVIVSNINGVVANILSFSDALCFNSCDGSATAIAIGGLGPYVYSWNNGSSDAATTGLCAGSFSVTITDASQCVDAAVVTIGHPAQLNSTLVASSVRCFSEANGSINISTTIGGIAPYNYQWQNGSVTATSTGLNAGVYSVTITDANDCIATFSSVVTQPTQLTVVAGNTVICSGSPAPLSAMASGSVPGYIYNWSSGQAGQNISVSPLVSAIYTVTVTDANACNAITTASVSVNDLPVVDFTSDVVDGCGPLCVTFTNTTANTSSMQWNFGHAATSVVAPATHCYNISGTYHVSLTVTDNNGCVNSLTKNNYITVYPDPIAAFSSNPNPATIIEPLVFFNDKSIGATLWQWSFGDVASSSSTLQHPSFSYTDTGKYEVNLVVTNEFGCHATATDYINIKPDYSFFIPNTFTPNQDGVNDLFMPSGFGWEAEKLEWYIFNRWGELIFFSDSFKQGWDGTAKDSHQNVQEDVYVWKIRLKDINGKLHQYQGHVTLLR